jgi:hypothetical protein
MKSDKFMSTSKLTTRKNEVERILHEPLREFAKLVEHLAGLDGDHDPKIQSRINDRMYVLATANKKNGREMVEDFYIDFVAMVTVVAEARSREKERESSCIN